MSAIIEASGDENAKTWAQGVVANFARNPQGNDTAQLKAVASGECAVTVANTYYLGRLIGSDDPANNAITDALTVIFPNQQDRGAHVNISGAGIDTPQIKIMRSDSWNISPVTSRNGSLPKATTSTRLSAPPLARSPPWENSQKIPSML